MTSHALLQCHLCQYLHKTPTIPLCNQSVVHLSFLLEVILPHGVRIMCLVMIHQTQLQLPPISQCTQWILEWDMQATHGTTPTPTPSA